jgi:selenide,water dikinase
MHAELADMLIGATGALAADGCALVGGHSNEAAEPALGFTVTGLADPSTLLRKSGLQPGDALLLTKPLGTGIILAGHMHGLARAAWLQSAIASMQASNAVASQLLREFGATACTNITDLGLAGHLMEMLQASGVAAALWVDALPVLPGALELAAQGVESTLAPQNRRVLSGAGTGARTALLFDPQTSGGLLAGVPANKAEACVAALHQHHVAAVVVGMVEAGDVALRLATARSVTRDTA